MQKGIPYGNLKGVGHFGKRRGKRAETVIILVTASGNAQSSGCFLQDDVLISTAVCLSAMQWS